MAELKLLYSDRSLLLHGSALIVLAGGYSQDEDGKILLTAECSSIEELNHYIDGFEHDLERARNQARAAFEDAKAKPPIDPFLD